MTTLKKTHYTERFDEQLGLIPHFQSYPRMRPFVGTEYGQHGPRILLIAESHYLPLESTIHLSAERWYDSTENDLCLQKERGSIHTREILNKNSGRWIKKGHTIFRQLEIALAEAGYPASDNMLKYIAFMNGFQRPAVSKLSINPTAQDVEISAKTVAAVIKTLQPEHVVFVSSKANRLIGKQLGIRSHSVPHPASAWWHRASKKGTGKSQFVSIIRNLLLPE
ncbi:hypothetical protein DFO67_1174 [Modicisalibacter xianhensis]|uniref:Uracil DNA glycosylase superfamily protein n=1 Tax=Modicisalibacter xianhensis TaxID=442341 RepID=A0A4R8FKW7_9GAMM|nr:hypothetical protein [Halomonas xianhensis]TDX26022.1 hypothetical protein DFO67_1174 [Halomonas xianhensis]